MRGVRGREGERKGREKESRLSANQVAASVN